MEFLLSKLQLIFLISLLITFILVIATLIIGMANTDRLYYDNDG